MANSTDFTGKVALVTGSSSGIGEEIAIQFAKYGANVIVTGLGEENITSVVAKCNEVSPKKLKALGLECDITNDEAVRELVAKTINSFGKLDILVNNAGIVSFAEIGAEDFVQKFDTVMKVNLRAPMFITNLCTPHLIKSKGNIVNISSVAGLHPFSNATAYCTSKAALVMFTKCLAIDLGPKGVRVNSVNPGSTRTPIFNTMGLGPNFLEVREKQVSAEYPLRRMGEPIDIAKMVLFLASNDASFVTGLISQVDGGALHTTSGQARPQAKD